MHFILPSIFSGALIGFLVSIPTGPVGFLCVKRTLVFGFKRGFISALGSIFADMVFAFIIVFGFREVHYFFENYEKYLAVLGGGAMIIMGFLGFMQKEIKEPTKIQVGGDFLSAFFLTITNPILLASYSALFAFFSKNMSMFKYSAFVFLFGVLLGALSWWFIFTMVTAFVHDKYVILNPNKINKISSFIVGLSGLVFILVVLF